MTAQEWVEEFAGEIGLTPPDQEQMDAILDLAAEAAHSSERTAAPIACWMAGVSGRPFSELADAAQRVGASPGS
ncbi:MAG: DUF6457 domain-containing protein [Solirubrobacterales bacterium]